MVLTDELKEIMVKLAEPLPEIGIQRTDKNKTKKGYDTIGYKSQFVINRFNEVLGINWGFEYKILKENEGAYGNGTKKIDIVIELSLWIIENKPEYTRIGIGGHTSFTYVDALKGSINNALKRAGAYFGVGRQAWEETVDEEDDPSKCAFEDHQQESGKKPSNSSHNQPQKPPQTPKPQNPKPAEQQPSEGKQETIADENSNGNGKGITPQILCGMVANATSRGKDKDDKTNYVKLWELYIYKQHGVKHLTELSGDQMIKEKNIIEKDGKPRPAAFRNFLKGYEKYLVQETPPDKKTELIQNIKMQLSDLFQGDRNRIDFYFSGLATSVATIDFLDKLTKDELIDVFNKVEITYNEHIEAQSYMHDQQEAMAVN